MGTVLGTERRFGIQQSFFNSAQLNPKVRSYLRLLVSDRCELEALYGKT